MAVNSVINTPAQTAATSSKRQPSVTDYQDMLGRVGNIPDLEQYEGAIRRMLSGESEMENPGSGKPLTEDQILMRKLKREYEKTNPLTFSQQSDRMDRRRRAAREQWNASGGSGPMPGCFILPDGTAKFYQSEEEKWDYQKRYEESFIRKVLSVIEERKAEREEKAEAEEKKSGNGFDVSV